MGRRTLQDSSISTTLVNEEGIGTDIAIHHTTHYQYNKPISLGIQTIRLRPTPHCPAIIKGYSLNIFPKNHYINWHQDHFGNYIATVKFLEKVKEFKINVDILAEIRSVNPFDYFLTQENEYYPIHYDEITLEELAPFLIIKEHSEKLIKFVDQFKYQSIKITDLLVEINQKIHTEIIYKVREEAGVQSCEETLDLKSGSCRDMAWLMCMVLRHLGLASRFCSGYLIHIKNNNNFTDFHAWAEVYLHDAGWIGLDPTSGYLTCETHIPLCCTPNPQTAAPISGVTEVCDSKLSFSMHLTKLSEKVEIEKPYTSHEWDLIDELGKKIDNFLDKQNVKLTMGGEPTFVSKEDRESLEWTYGAIGKNKRKKANEFLLNLRKRFAPNALIHFGQGKQYPGEEIPRWSLNCFWRKDGEIFWDQEAVEGNELENPNYQIEDSKKLIQEIANQFKIDHKIIISTNTSGYVMPLIFGFKSQCWITSDWGMDKIKLIPIETPIGYRLPIMKMKFPKESELELPPEIRIQENPSPLPSRKVFLEKKYHKTPIKSVKTALCVEVREGRLYVFLPPTAHLEHFIELITQVEKSAKTLGLRVILEGYDPPVDPRIENFRVTPDPGVLEINIHPAASWKELKEIHIGIYQEAENIHLSPYKYLLDGLLVGTGGGNHIILGGKKPNESPFFRRADLLRSFVTFWQHHPSLSYLFSSVFIGPTSQAPRVDEARHDSLYELDIAFSKIEEGKESPVWLVDRLLRYLLVDVTGNFHRAEFCIDKLYNPHSPLNRQGLVEMRAFEMQPHPQMSLVILLLLRALTANFWNKPYSGKLIRWGTTLHDKFLLPFYLWRDFRDIIHELNHESFPFELEWFRPHYNFRFPILGTTQVENINIELRRALEIWPVLGEETLNVSTSRGVDSSTEKIQVKVTGILTDRYIITCNGIPLNLRPTEEKDVYVSGVRYKAWDSTFCLHPYIPIHSPLVFDVIDRYHRRSLGGCRYHVKHPGGRGYEKMPLTLEEAEARRTARFEPFGHTPGEQKIKAPLEPDSEFPYTLDLRKYM